MMTTVFKKTIENTTVNTMKEKSYQGEIHIIHETLDVNKAIATLERYKHIGFDTETKPTFKKGIRNQVALLQLACKECVFLFQLKKIKDFSALESFFQNNDILKVGVAIQDDIKGLNKYFKIDNKSFVELQSYVKEFGIQEASLKKLTAITLGFRISKSQQVSNWEAAPLKDSQISYAATDAWVSLEIYEKLLSVKSTNTTKS